MLMRLLLLLVTLSPFEIAKSTHVVNAGGGPGVNFTTLPAAVTAAVAEDTILVQTVPSGEGATPFTTNKGLTIVGAGSVIAALLANERQRRLPRAWNSFSKTYCDFRLPYFWVACWERSDS
jgi:hypothetical protein